MPTPHINANFGDFADTVLMPGDPLRAKYIAETFLNDVIQLTDIRGMLGFTGHYLGRKISIMGHGMGIPSAAIYTKELITDFGVKKLIRIGSCGAVRKDIHLHDIVIGLGACTDSKVNRTRFGGHDFSAIADYFLVNTVMTVAEQKNITVKIGNLFSSDLFYHSNIGIYQLMERYGIIGVEMEAAGIYAIAAEYKAQALAICTVSDHLMTGESFSLTQRMCGFNKMIELVLDSILFADNV